jgi:hypothetical protein
VNLVDSAQKLAEAAIASQLVLFLGAGVSAGAGLPDWKGLLAKIAEDVEFEPRDRLESVDPRDQATILQRQLEMQKKSLGKTVAMQLTDTHYSLVGGLLASLAQQRGRHDQLRQAIRSRLVNCRTKGRRVAA